MKPWIHPVFLMAVAAVGLTACSDGPQSPPIDARDQLLDQALAVASTDPVRAADLFARAGPGPSLEETRMAVWADCLRRSSAPPEMWRRYLADQPSPRLAGRARLELIRALVETGAVLDAIAERNMLSSDLQPAGDEALLSTTDPERKLQAASRLLITSPKRLAAREKGLEQRLVKTLSPEDRLSRSRAWRREGAPSKAAVELRSLKWSGALEVERRRELARAEIESGSPLRALRVLPDGRNATAEDYVLRAQAYRNRAWHLYPGRGEIRAFSDCLGAVQRAADSGLPIGLFESAHALGLECATENGQLQTALESWNRLETTGRHWPRREWLGRRLGVALAIAGAPNGAAGIARALPAHERCLRFWISTTSSGGRNADPTLAEAPVADLYAVWVRESSGSGLTTASGFSPPLPPGTPPDSVRRLIDVGAPAEAVRQWRRIRRQRSTSPAESLAASALSAASGYPTDSIRWLRAGFPSLGTVNVSTAPRNAAEAYLPLRWSGSVIAAAREFGVDPWLLAGIARQESTFTAHAVSPRGAVGVIQLLPSTARVHARALGLGSNPDLRDPATNFRLGARELSVLLRKFGAVEPALAAYNAGETRVRTWWRRQPDRSHFTEEIPVPETYNYVRRVVYLSEAYRQLYSETWRQTP